MPMPDSHARFLEDPYYGRNEMRRAFEMLDLVLAHPQFRAALDELHDDEELRRNVRGTAVKEHLIRRGVDVPSEVAIYLVSRNWRISLCITLSTGIGDIQVGAHYDSHDGWGWGC